MLTDQEIRNLVASSKRIINKSPAIGYDQKAGSRRCSLDLESIDEDDVSFSVFIRQNIQFIENYSIGLLYKTRNRNLKAITLVRYNGPHGASSRGEDGHYAMPHIHNMTAEEMRSGSLWPQEKSREITEKYNSFESALRAFFDDAGLANWQKYFPELRQGELFNGLR